MKHFSDLAIQLIADAKIQQAYDDGKFDPLSGYGKPFNFENDGTFPNWAKAKAQHEEIKALLQRKKENSG